MKKGLLVGVRFYDHFMDSGNPTEPIICDVVGILGKEDEHYYYLITWVCNNQLFDNNSEFFAVLKSTIINSYVLHHERVRTFKNKESYEVRPSNLGRNKLRSSKRSPVSSGKIQSTKNSKVASGNREFSKRFKTLQSPRTFGWSEKGSRKG